MKSQFQAKLIQALANKKSNKGFTLIELLVVVIIIGVLAAVALPNLLGQVGKARETEGKNGVGSINRAQQAFHFEKQKFADSTAVPDVAAANNALGSVVQSQYYGFTLGSADVNTQATVTATSTDATKNGTRNYQAGITYDNGKYYTVICQSNEIGGDTTSAADLSAVTNPTCSATSTALK